MTTKNQVKNRNQPKDRGRQAKPSLSNYNSIIDSIQHVQDKKNVEVAKDLAKYYEMLRKLACREDEYAKAGIKDHLMAVRWHIDLADKLMEEHYEFIEGEDGEEEESGEQGSNTSSKAKANGTTGLSLISLDYDEE